MALVNWNSADQRRLFDGVNDKLAAVGERFPAVQGVLNVIRRRKSKVRTSHVWAGGRVRAQVLKQQHTAYTVVVGCVW